MKKEMKIVAWRWELTIDKTSPGEVSNTSDDACALKTLLVCHADKSCPPDVRGDESVLAARNVGIASQFDGLETARGRMLTVVLRDSVGCSSRSGAQIPSEPHKDAVLIADRILSYSAASR
jgi:hypothetical protein